MMKQYLKILLLFLLTSSRGHAQIYGNEWINFSQKYYAFNIYTTGIQRIDYSALSASGVPLSSFTSNNIQIFGRQQEIPILVVDGNDNSFDAGDYILFYVKKNDGWLDTLVYRGPNDIANPNISLYNDTIQYFFTWNNLESNKRFTVDTDTGFGNYGSPASYVLKDLTWGCQAASMIYSEGYRLDKASGSFYAPGEGWGCGGVNLDGFNVNIDTYNAYTGADAPLATIEASITSNSNAQEHPDHHLHMDIGASDYQLIDSVFEAYQLIKYIRTLPAGTITGTPTALTFASVPDLGAAADRMNLNYWKLRYPRLPNAISTDFDDFYIENNPNSTKTQIDLAGILGTDVVAFSFGSTARALTPVQNGPIWQMLVPDNSSGPSTYVVVGNLATAIPVTSLSPVNGSGDFTDFSTLSMENALLMIYHPKLQEATSNYANYRASGPGGSHNVVLANIEELYQQYGGGIEKHILAIRRFAEHSNNNASNDNKPKGLFLIGKGISEAGNAGTRQVTTSFEESLIPSFGYPSSDIAITAGMYDTTWTPLIPTGRISIKTNQELQDYLDKVIQYESVQVQNDPNNYSPATKEWQKKILHFVGGSTSQQQETFQTYMNNMKNVIEDTLYAGHVTSYFKTTSDPLDPNVIAGVTDHISNGVSLMTFFGHAAVSNNGFEINIDEPVNWENHGKYPVVLGNSCYNGDIFTTALSTSEKFVNLPDEGAIAFISSVSVGYDYYLALYSRRLYEEFSYRSYGKTLAQQMSETIRFMRTQWFPSDLFGESTCLQMTLHGDPMLRLNWHERPEIDISSQNIYFEPSNLNLTVDSIELNLILTNLGKSVTQPFNIEIRRNFPGATIDSVYQLSMNELQFKDTVHFKMPMQPNIGIGINQFKITADIPSAIPEQAQEITNNQLTYDYFINVDGILPVYPYDFAVIPYDTPTVRASTVNPIAGIQTYRFQIDTTDTYDSPQFRQFSVTDSGGVKEVTFDQWKNGGGNPAALICTDSTVYFWRVAVDSTVLNWTEYSFQYIEGKTGWGQDHFFQFKKNDFYNIVYNRTNRLREFSPPDTHTVSIFAFDNPGFPHFYFNRWEFDNDANTYGTTGVVLYGAPAVYVFVLDPITLEPWKTRYLNENPDHNFGNGNDNPDGNCGGCHSRADAYFVFDQNNPQQLSALRNMLENEVPNGFYVGAYTNYATLYSMWDTHEPELYTTFQNLGSTLINNSQPEKPFALFVKKGDPSTLVESHYPDTIHINDVYGGLPGNAVHLDAEVLTTDATGIERTPMIGPAYDWGTLYWKRDSLELFIADSVQLYLELYNLSGALQMTIDTLFTPNDSIIQLNNLVDASTYPFLRLGMYYTDEFFQTPAQVDRLHILYSPVPEAAIDGTHALYINPLLDTLQEGQIVSLAVDVRNISDFDMDSLLINYWLEDANRVKHPVSYPRQMPLFAGDTLRDTVQFSTHYHPGQNSLWMEVNPYINGSAYQTDQLEQYHFNNLLQIPIYVETDDIHPILDVTFDGKHILNGDIISPESEVLITLKDDNPYLIMNEIGDTAAFGIYLTDPDGIQRRIPFMDGNGNMVMQWIPADAQNKKFKIIYPGLFDQDGKYSLIVQGTDKTGNISGDIEYRIAFEIVHESSITYMMNYPNPFSTSTRFVFTVTGTEAPDDMIIQIMTVTGRVVREITEAEIGRISIGRNITEFAWDGTDEFGDPLANGVYLYRVKAKLNGEEMKHRETAADSHFKKEFGKMYLMR